MEKRLPIKGVQKTTMIDFPGKIASTVFLSHCNFRCHFCHNPELVFDKTGEEDIPVEEILAFIESKKEWIDGVCITGGEPTLHPALVDFIKNVKSHDLAVKLDTNGTNPEMLALLLDKNLLDYIAMDIKTSKDKYEKAVGTVVDIEKIEKSIKLIIESGIDYEFRTTVVPGLYDPEDLELIADWLKGAKRYVLQQFRTSDSVLDPEYQHIKPYSLNDLEDMCEKGTKYFEECILRS